MKRSRQSNEQSLKDVINELFEGNNMNSKLKEIHIINQWEKLVGSLIAKNTDKIYFNNGKLFLHINSAPLRSELTYSKSKIIELVNTEAGLSLIEDVVIR
jgi:predicted nucleic acid-binding Zn ribbon protein